MGDSLFVFKAFAIAMNTPYGGTLIPIYMWDFEDTSGWYRDRENRSTMRETIETMLDQDVLHDLLWFAHTPSERAPVRSGKLSINSTLIGEPGVYLLTLAYSTIDSPQMLHNDEWALNEYVTVLDYKMMDTFGLYEIFKNLEATPVILDTWAMGVEEKSDGNKR